MSTFVPDGTWREIVRHTPLVSIDLLVFDDADRVLLGLRTNEPARGTWFVPGGRVRKDETLDAAFARLTETELGIRRDRADSTLRGVYEHLYDTNYADEPGTGTHYVVLGHDLRAIPDLAALPCDQHAEWRWAEIPALLADPQVHENTKAYFR